MKHAPFAAISSALLILLWVYTATSKLLDRAAFEYTLEKAPFIGRWATFLATGIPLVELGVATLLLTNRWRLQGLMGSAALLVLFTLYIAAGLVTAKDLPCSCGGVISSMGWSGHLLFNTIMIWVALAGLYRRRQHLLS